MEKKEILDQLNAVMTDQSKKCNNTSRYIVYAIFASSWGGLFKADEYIKGQADNKSLIIITLVLSIIYLTLEVVHYYLGTTVANRLFDKLYADKIDGNIAIKRMNKTSSLTYVLMTIKLSLILIMVALLLIYYIGIL